MQRAFMDSLNQKKSFTVWTATFALTNVKLYLQPFYVIGTQLEASLYGLSEPCSMDSSFISLRTLGSEWLEPV